MEHVQAPIKYDYTLHAGSLCGCGHSLDKHQVNGPAWDSCSGTKHFYDDSGEYLTTKCKCPGFIARSVFHPEAPPAPPLDIQSPPAAVEKVNLPVGALMKAKARADAIKRERALNKPDESVPFPALTECATKAAPPRNTRLVP